MKNILDHFHFYSTWYYSNLTGVITVSSNGEIIDCDPYFCVLLGYSNSKLNLSNINTVFKFNSFGN